MRVQDKPSKVEPYLPYMLPRFGGKGPRIPSIIRLMKRQHPQAIPLLFIGVSPPVRLSGEHENVWSWEGLV